jgi:hypothetical protein
MDLKTLAEKKILFLGRPRAFSQEEFEAQLKVHKILLTKELDESIERVLEGRMMTPYEQNLSEELYKKGGFTFLDITSFEKALAQNIDDDVLVMSLKLSKDKERLKSFLKNSCISDTLFFKLLAMYDYQGEDFFENDDNRDVTAALIGRFYENIERNHNVQYATTGLIHLILQTSNAELLEHISNLEPVALHPKIKILLAQHPQTPQNVLKRLLRESDAAVLAAMSQNPALDIEHIKQLIAYDAVFAKSIAKNVKLTEELFRFLQKQYSVALAENPTLDAKMQQELLAKEQEAIDYSLAKNPSLTQATVAALQKNKDLKSILYCNPALDEELLRRAFDDEALHVTLASNTATPKDILQALYASENEQVLKALAANEATPVELLYQLQLDSRFERAVRTNAAFGKHIQSENIGWLV